MLSGSIVIDKAISKQGNKDNNRHFLAEKGLKLYLLKRKNKKSVKRRFF